MTSHSPQCDNFQYVTSSGEESLERYLSLDLSVKCGYPEFTDEYQAMRYYAVIMILVFPVTLSSLNSNPISDSDPTYP